MVRNYVPRSARKVTSPRKLKAALESVLRGGWKVRAAAKHHNVNRQTLWKTVKKAKENPNEEPKVEFTYANRSVFSKEVEESIAAYCRDVAEMGYGLSVQCVRELAFEVASKNEIDMPQNWKEHKLAGIDWFYGFMKRNPNLSIRVPEACSVARAMAFNQPTVEQYFEKLEKVINRHESFKNGSHVYNLDETCTSTVQNVTKVISPKGAKQVHQIKGAERGVSVTTAVIIGANGTLLPPVMIFPRKKFVSSLLINAFPGTLGLANEKGYMTKETFVPVIEHFIKHTQASKENPQLLFLDNVESHFSVQTLDLAREHGVTIFTFPPHSTHKLQPLDVGFFGPFKRFYDHAITSYYHSNPAQPATIYHIAGFVSYALGKAGNVMTILNSFRATGISPFDKHIFTEADFVMASVTKKPAPDETSKVNENSQDNCDVAVVTEKSDASEVVSSSGSPHDTSENLNESSRVTEKAFLSPADLRGYPKAKARNSKRKERRKGKCMVATDTPEKLEIEEREKAQKLKKKQAKERLAKRKESVGIKRTQGKEPVGVKRAKVGSKQTKKGKVSDVVGKAKRVLTYESDDSEAADDVTIPSNATKKIPSEGDFVLISEDEGNKKLFYVGKVINNCDTEELVQVSYLAKGRDPGQFNLRSPPKLGAFYLNDIKAILPKPTCPTGKRGRRRQPDYHFDFDFSSVKLG